MKTIYESILSSTNTGIQKIISDWLKSFPHCKIGEDVIINNDGTVTVSRNFPTNFLIKNGEVFIETYGNNNGIKIPENIVFKKINKGFLIKYCDGIIPKQFKNTLLKPEEGAACFRLDKTSDVDMFVKFFKNIQLDFSEYKGITCINFQCYDTNQCYELLAHDFSNTNIVLSCVNSDSDIFKLSKIKNCTCKDLLIGRSWYRIEYMIYDRNDTDVLMQNIITQLSENNNIHSITIQLPSAQFGDNIYWDKKEGKYKIDVVKLYNKRRKPLNH